MAHSKLNSAINLKLPTDDFLYNRFRIERFIDWLTHNNIQHRFMYAYLYDETPHIILLNSQDAIAFKITFGL